MHAGLTLESVGCHAVGDARLEAMESLTMNPMPNKASLCFSDVFHLPFRFLHFPIATGLENGPGFGRWS